MKILAILINIGFPGIGTFFTGKFFQAILQLILVFFSFGFWATGVLFFMGIAFWCVAWFWGMYNACTWVPRSEHVAPSSGIGR